MKLLFDQNISFKLPKQISDYYPLAKQIKQVGLEDCNDSKIWEYARQNNYVIENLDLIQDFIQSPDYKELSCLEID